MRISRILLVKVVGNFLVVFNQTLLSMERLSLGIIFVVIRLPVQPLDVQSLFRLGALLDYAFTPNKISLFQGIVDILHAQNHLRIYVQ